MAAKLTVAEIMHFAKQAEVLEADLDVRLAVKLVETNAVSSADCCATRADPSSALAAFQDIPASVRKMLFARAASRNCCIVTAQVSDDPVLKAEVVEVEQ